MPLIARLTSTLFTGLLVAACSPTFNWREVPVADAGMVALMPCKVDKANRALPLGGALVVEVDMVGCEAGGATFAIAHAAATDAAQATQWLAAWREATAAQLVGTTVTEAAGVLPRAASQPAPLRLTATGGMAAQILWFAQPMAGGQMALYQATVLGQPATADAATTFFEGLRLP